MKVLCFLVFTDISYCLPSSSLLFPHPAPPLHLHLSLCLSLYYSFFFLNPGSCSPVMIYKCACPARMFSVVFLSHSFLWLTSPASAGVLAAYYPDSIHSKFDIPILHFHLALRAECEFATWTLPFRYPTDSSEPSIALSPHVPLLPKSSHFFSISSNWSVSSAFSIRLS